MDFPCVSLDRYRTKTSSNGVQFLTGLLSAAALDAALFWMALKTGVAWHSVHLASFSAAVVLTFLLGSLYHRVRPFPPGRPGISTLDIVIFLCVLFLRGGFLATLIDLLDVSLEIAAICGAVFSAAAFFGGRRVCSFDSLKTAEEEAHHIRWRAGAVIVFVVLLRLLYSGPVELLHEEAYYWLYAQFLDIGYLDHPPMVGWLIWLFTSFFGPSEFAIRIGAFACWLITAWYVVRLSKAIGDNRAGLMALVLVAVLPVFVGTGMVMIPDAPLVACWAAALYYLYTAVIEERPSAWLGVGISMGLGLLSKYTMVLLGGAAWVFILLAPEGRKWLKMPHPYLATLIALALFSPVIVWNAENDWASFYFQGIGRHMGSFNFGLQDLIGSSLVLLTPAGLISLVKICISRKRFLSRLPHSNSRQSLHLLAYLTLLPLSVFFLFSLFRMSKLIWTAPIWLGALPYLAVFINPIGGDRGNQPEGRMLFPQLWPLTTATLLVVYAAFLHYLALGLPGIPYPQNFMDIGKRSVAQQIYSARKAFTEKTSEKPVVVCSNVERMASWMAYYLYREDPGPTERGLPEAVRNTTGAHLFGEDSKMFRHWHPLDGFRNRPLMLILENKEELKYGPDLSKATTMSDIKAMFANNKTKPSGKYFYRFIKANLNWLTQSKTRKSF